MGLVLFYFIFLSMGQNLYNSPMKEEDIIIYLYGMNLQTLPVSTNSGLYTKFEKFLLTLFSYY